MSACSFIFFCFLSFAGMSNLLDSFLQGSFVWKYDLRTYIVEC